MPALLCDGTGPHSEGPLFRKSIVQIRATVLTFGLKLGLRLGLGLGLALGLGFLGLVGIVDFQNSGPESFVTPFNMQAITG